MRRRSSNHRPTALWQIGFWFGLALIAASGVPKARAGTKLAGHVRTDRGRELDSGVSLTVKSEGGAVVDQGMVNSDGQFEFNGLSNEVYHLEVDVPGFQHFRQEVDLTGPRGYMFVDVILVPVAKKKMMPADLPALTDEAAPPKAHKEYKKGSRALAEKKLEEARLHFQNAVGAYPCYARAQTDLALALILKNQLPPAEAALKKSISCDGGFLPAYARLSQLYNGERRFTESEKILEDGLRLSPNAWELYYQLAAAHSGMEQYAEAKQDYLRVRALNPAPPPEIHVELADLYHRMKAYDNAYAEMQAYLREDPNGRFASRTKIVMQELVSAGVVHVNSLQQSGSKEP